MNEDYEGFFKELKKNLELFDEKNVEKNCNLLIEYLRSAQEKLDQEKEYVMDDEINSFQLQSTLRQFKYIWELPREGGKGEKILALLEGAAVEKRKSHQEAGAISNEEGVSWPVESI